MTYVFQTGIADALRGAGLTVVEHTGWETEGRHWLDEKDHSKGTFDYAPHAVVMHHDASADGPTPGEPAYILHGRPPEDPGPLAQCWVAYGGVWHVLAAGRCNHAGDGIAVGRIAQDQGNRDAIGVEWDHTTGEPVPAATRGSIVRGLAALLRMLHANPSNALIGHLEYAPGRKFDPDAKALPMAQLRADVAQQMRHPAPTPEDDDMQLDDRFPVVTTAGKAAFPKTKTLGVAQSLELAVAYSYQASVDARVARAIAEKAATVAGPLTQSEVDAIASTTAEAVADEFAARLGDGA